MRKVQISGPEGVVNEFDAKTVDNIKLGLVNAGYVSEEILKHCLVGGEKYIHNHIAKGTPKSRPVIEVVIEDGHLHFYDARLYCVTFGE